ncbi:MAG: hypothetical protein JW798_00985 [Prolixibacteraceae bacterium]|nr:hypothetical protein [Prolixibacteraceae bacterium]
MIQQMSGKLFCFFLLLIWVVFPVQSQEKVKKASSDTLVIYETQIVYDTLYVYDTVRVPKPGSNIPAQTLEYDNAIQGITSFPYDTSLMPDTVTPGQFLDKSSNTSYPYKPLVSIPLTSLSNKYISESEKFLCESPATKFKKGIITAKSNMKLMKSERYHSINADGYAWGISAGGGGWRAQSFDGNLRSDVLFSPHAGIFCEKKVARHVTCKVELNYTWTLNKGIHFQHDDFMDSIQSASLEEVKYTDIFSWDVDGEDDAGFGFSQVDIPFQVGYQIGSFRPYVGFKYSHRFKHNQLHKGNYFSALAGTDILLSNRLSLGVSYSCGLGNEVRRNGQILGTTVGNIIVLPDSKVVISSYPAEEHLSNNTGALSSQRIDISLYINLHRN